MNKEQRNAFPTGINNPQSRSANILTEFTVFLTLFILDVGPNKKKPQCPVREALRPKESNVNINFIAR